jgi:hypothetical protein
MLVTSRHTLRMSAEIRMRTSRIYLPAKKPLSSVRVKLKPDPSSYKGEEPFYLHPMAIKLILTTVTKNTEEVKNRKERPLNVSNSFAFMSSKESFKQNFSSKQNLPLGTIIKTLFLRLINKPVYQFFINCMEQVPYSEADCCLPHSPLTEL